MESSPPPPAAGFPPPEGRLPFIDALRGLAALYVALFHLALLAQPALALPGWLQSFIQAGGAGVTLFFLVSAFTLTLSLRQRAGEPRTVLRFYIRRVFRIVPLFYVWLALSWARDRFYFGVTHSPGEVLLNALFLYHFVPGWVEGYVWAGWTLGVEMFFYLLFPLIYRAIDDIGKAVGSVFLALLASGAFVSLNALLPLSPGQHSAYEHYSRYSLLRHLPVFLLGMTLYFLYERIRSRNLHSRSVAFALAALAFYAFLQLLSGKLALPFEERYSVAALLAVLLIALAVFPLPLFVNRATRFYGDISYSVYLNHPLTIYALSPAFRWIYALPLPVTGKWFLCASLLLAVLTPLSYATYRWIEQPGIRLGSRWIRRLAAP